MKEMVKEEEEKKNNLRNEKITEKIR